jgi:hypothetical protein
VNAAFTSIFSPFGEIEPAEYRRVTEVSYLGYVYCTMAVLKKMRARDRRTIVQVGSALAYRGIPLQTAYCGAKHAIQGFHEALRCELLHDKSNVRVTMPQMPGVNTPQFSWVLSRLPHQAQPVPPIYQPEFAARGVLYAADHPKRREYWVGSSTVGTLAANAIAPGLLDRYLGRAHRRFHHPQHDLHHRCFHPRRIDLAVPVEHLPIPAVRRGHHRRRPVGLRQLSGMGHQQPAAAAQLRLATPHPFRTPRLRVAPPAPGRTTARRSSPARSSGMLSGLEASVHIGSPTTPTTANDGPPASPRSLGKRIPRTRPGGQHPGARSASSRTNTPHAECWSADRPTFPSRLGVTMDITDLILNDHHEQRRLFAYLDEIEKTNTTALGAVWERLKILLDVHAAAEEALFYPQLLKIGTGGGGETSAASETKDVIKDHNEIRDAVAEVG